MLSVNIICIGSLKEKYLTMACEEYIKRLGAFCKLKVTELNEYKLPSNPSSSQIQKAVLEEGNSILSVLNAKNSYNIAMCIEGKHLSSEQLARQLEKISVGGQSSICFLIGGSYGLYDEVKKKADLNLSMSSMTFPHQLARVMLLEQVYRAFQINNNGKYHK